MNITEKLLALNFAEWIAENHFRMYNIENGLYYWENENENKTTEELFNDYNTTKALLKKNYNR